MDHGAEQTNLMFMAGQSNADNVKGIPPQAIIACVSAEAQKLVLVKEHIFANKPYQGITSIRRLRPNTNEFAIGVYQSIVLVEFQQNQFIELMTFEKLHSGSLRSPDLVEDIAVYGGDIYSVCIKDKFVNNIKLINF
jgi:hypothetical protein